MYAQIPPRPQMPTAADQERAQMQCDRLNILNDDWRELINEWLAEHIGKDRRHVWGIPDISANPLADLSRQLSIPGLYGRAPHVQHGVDNLEALLGQDGYLAQAGLWTKMQQVQYYTLGIGDFAINVNVVNDRLVLRLVPPHNLLVKSSADDPQHAVCVYELRLMYDKTTETYEWVWELFDIGHDGTEAQHRVILANRDGSFGPDVSDRYLSSSVVGDEYPYRSADGQAVVPYSFYRSSDTGTLWNTNSNRGIVQGTLNTALYWTYVGHSARDATGSFTIVSGLAPLGATTHKDQYGNTVSSMTITPGALAYHEPTSDSQPFVQSIGSGINLKDLTAFADLYEMKQAVRYGLNPTDLTRQSANPASGAALMISNSGKREYSAQVEPLYRHSDLHTLRLCAIVLNRAGLGPFPESGYTISYAEIKNSPAEARERREDIQWQVDNGYLSPVDAYKMLNPGVSDEDARAALVKSRTDEFEISTRVAQVVKSESDDTTPQAALDSAVASTPGKDTGSDVAKTALNGAQIKSLLDLVSAVAAGTIDRESAIEIVQVSFPTVDAATAELLISTTVNRGNDGEA